MASCNGKATLSIQVVINMLITEKCIICMRCIQTKVHNLQNLWTSSFTLRVYYHIVVSLHIDSKLRRATETSCRTYMYV